MKTTTIVFFVLLTHVTMSQSLVQREVISKADEQKELNMFLNTINNNDIDIGWISFPAVNIFGSVSPNKPKGDTLVKRKYYTVTSFIDSLGGIDFLIRKYTKSVVAKQLVGLLNDTTKDFYAHALLCEIFNQKKLGQIYFKERKREDWVGVIKKDDIKYWHSLAYSK